MLGIGLGSSGRATGAFNCGTIPPAPCVFSFGRYLFVSFEHVKIGLLQSIFNSLRISYMYIIYLCHIQLLPPYSQKIHLLPNVIILLFFLTHRIQLVQYWCRVPSLFFIVTQYQAHSLQTFYPILQFDIWTVILLNISFSETNQSLT